MTDPTTVPQHEGRFLPEVEQVLRQAGWYPRRAVQLPQLEEWLVIDWPLGNRHFQTRIFSAAWRVLREFGNLKIEQDAPGITCYRHSFIINPLAVRDSNMWNYNWFVDEWSVDGALFPLGMYNVKECAFAVDGKGNIINDNGQIFGRSIEEALTNLIVGYRPEIFEVPKDKFLEASYNFPHMLKRFGLG